MSKAADSAAAALLLLLALTFPAAGAELRAGFGVAELPTPERGPLAGYGGWRDRNAEGLADTPEARALVLERGTLRLALVALDVLLIRPELRDALLAPAREGDVDSVMLVATHTHSGPGGYIRGFVPERITGGSFREDAHARIGAAATEALTKALDTLAPASVASAATELALAQNRRGAGGPAETQLPILRIDREGARSVLLFAYGMHPTVRSSRSRLYSADYVGRARADLEAAGWQALFLPGPLGDQNPASQLGPLWNGDLKLEELQTREVGSALALTVGETARELRPRPGADLAALERWVELPGMRARRFCSLWWLGPVLRRSLRGFLSARVPVHAVRVGEAVIVGVPGEPTSALGSAIRRGAPAGSVPFVVSHANDWVGYALSRDSYQRGGYEACLSFHGPELGAWLVEASLETLDRMDASRR